MACAQAADRPLTSRGSVRACAMRPGRCAFAGCAQRCREPARQAGTQCSRPVQGALCVHHGTPDPPSRSSAPGRPARAPMSDRASRDLARQHGRRARRAAHRQMHTRAHESRAPVAEARLDAQRAQQARHDQLPRAHKHETAHASDALATRSARAAARSAAAGRPVSRQSHSLIGLRRG